jgi:MFS transporter, UMF1 family
MTSAIEVIEDVPKTSRKGILGWMFFDWAAQPFFTVVTTFVFGPYFVSRLTSDPVAAQTDWSNMATISSFVIAILSPILGSIADTTGAKKNWIGFFAVIKISSLMMLWFAAPGSPVVYPMIFMILASISAEFSIVFNDSMMPRLVAPKDVGRISNLAWGLGYAGGMIVLFAVILLLAGNPATGKTLIGITPLFGLDPALGEDARITGPISAIWYFIFILPMFFFTPDMKSTGTKLTAAVAEGLVGLKETLVELAQTKRSLLRFLIARMIYQDGVNGLIILGGTFAAGLFGWATIEIGIYGIILNIVAIASNMVAGWLDSRIGSKNVVVLSLISLLLATVGIVSTASDSTLFGLVALSPADSGGLFGTAAEKCFIFYGLFIGIAFGPVQASSRSFLSRSIRPDEAGRYFGIYALSGRATSFMATLTFSIVTAATGSAYLGMSTLAIFLVVGLVLLVSTPYPATEPA